MPIATGANPACFAYHEVIVYRPSASLLLALALATPFFAQSSSKHIKTPAAPTPSALNPGTVANNVYRNKTLALTCQIPDGWVLRTDELNSHDEDRPTPDPAAQVLLAAFSRPPQAKGEDINSSILIAAETQSSYPGLKQAAQYFGPLTEVAKAQGFTADGDPYEITIGTKTLVRADFHKDVGTRVMRQSTLAMLSHGFAVSITLIAGTEEEVEDLIARLMFTTTK